MKTLNRISLVLPTRVLAGDFLSLPWGSDGRNPQLRRVGTAVSYSATTARFQQPPWSSATSTVAVDDRSRTAARASVETYREEGKMDARGVERRKHHGIEGGCAISLRCATGCPSFRPRTT